MPKWMVPESDLSLKTLTICQQGLSFRGTAAQCDVFEDAIDASLIRWLNRDAGPWKGMRPGLKGLERAEFES